MKILIRNRFHYDLAAVLLKMLSSYLCETHPCLVFLNFHQTKKLINPLILLLLDKIRARCMSGHTHFFSRRLQYSVAFKCCVLLIIIIIAISQVSIFFNVQNDAYRIRRMPFS